MLLILFGCEKLTDTLPDPVTVEVVTEGLISTPMTKSFNPDTWVYNYNSD